MERKTFSFLFLLLLVLASDVAVERGEARTCMIKKEGWGKCLIDTTCAHSCKNRGYIGGNCKGMTRTCYCLVNC
uniref:Plant defensin n=2 Tax=Vigna TaxID=3913 RepID=Q6T418_VIGRA|nr:plant defensin precursor [Vigna radiata]AAX98672.1 defensin-like protein [Vigna nakashimae]ACN22750.1 plant defensin [Vigna radiata]